MEKSRAGANIYRYQGEGRQCSQRVAQGNPQDWLKITKHIEKCIGPITATYAEQDSEFVSLFLHVVGPTKERNFYTVVTSGMSDRAMRVPPGCEALRFGELLISLPPEWPMDPIAWDDPSNYWPIYLLKYLARFPHARDSWLFAMHTIPNGNPPAPFAPSTKLSAALVYFPPSPHAFHELKVSEEKEIHFHSVIPIHEDEMNLVLDRGLDALTACFGRAGVSEVIDPSRPSAVDVLRQVPLPPGPAGGKR
jgi:hypothetical protein